MTRTYYMDNWHVRVEPNSWTWETKPDKIRALMKVRCEEIAKQIKRHCDDFSGVAVIGEPVYVCAHCGYDWGTESETYNGGCCAKDEENNPDADVVESPRFPNVSCSQCGRNFGPGDHGFSHCDNHKHLCAVSL